MAFLFFKVLRSHSHINRVCYQANSFQFLAYLLVFFQPHLNGSHFWQVQGQFGHGFYTVRYNRMYSHQYVISMVKTLIDQSACEISICYCKNIFCIKYPCFFLQDIGKESSRKKQTGLQKFQKEVLCFDKQGPRIF